MINQDMVEEFNIKGKRIDVIFGNITNVTADVVVSSDDNHLSMGGGVSMAIHKAAGEIVWEETRKYVPAQLGAVVVTSAGNLHAKYIFHAVVIDFDQFKWPDVETLKTVTTSCLLQADKLSCRTIAMPAFGTGVGGLSSEAAAIAVINAIFENLEKVCELQKVILVLNRRGILFDFVKAAIEMRIRAEYEPKLEALKAEKEKLVAELQEKSPYRGLPFPIAVTRHLANSYGNYHSKFSSSIECAESLLIFCACVTLAENIKISPLFAGKLYEFFKQPASLGSWQDLLEKSLISLKDQSKSPVISLIRNAYLSKNKGYFTEIVDARNKIIAHGATLADDVYKPEYEKLIKKVDALLRDFAFLSNYPLLVVDQTDFTENGISYDVTKLMGDNVIFPKENIIVSNLHLAKCVLYMYDEANEQALCLHPFLIFETCPFCQIQETFFLEKNTEKEGTYHTYRANHRITTDKYIDLLKRPKKD
jgi:O-acetyl-ADP-ribose deacetylase (regulator of RNase III)